MRNFKTLAVLLLTIGLIGLMSGSSVLMAHPGGGGDGGGHSGGG